MIIAELMEKLDSLSEDDRAEQLKMLFRHLSKISLRTVLEFQQKWKCQQPFNEFMLAQNDVIRWCVVMECSPLGDAVHAAMGSPPLTMETKIEND